MAIRDWSAYQRALRAAAGVTGVLRRHGAAIAAAAALTTASGCAVHGGAATSGPVASERSTTEPTAGPATAKDRSELTDTERAELEALGDCTESDGQMLGYNSPCCVRYREITGERFGPIGCTPWGPPAPPAYDGQRLA